MITDGVIAAFVHVIREVFALMPSIRLPSFLLPGGDLEQLAASLSFDGLGAWLPTGALVGAYGAYMAALAVSLLVKIIRMCVSLLTGGGGNAG